jgi:hypothetical protein
MKAENKETEPAIRLHGRLSLSEGEWEGKES